jgi:lipid-A-disaccharide synthase
LDAKEILIVAGESSADAHAAALVRELGALHPQWRFYGVGGPRLKEAGAEIVVPMSQVTVMGFSEVIPKLKAVRDALRVLAESVLERLPDAAISKSQPPASWL